MRPLVQKSLNHLYYIFKVYLCLALIGALAGIGMQLLLSQPISVLTACAGLGLVLTGVLIGIQARRIRENGLKQARVDQRATHFRD
jgi:hypothetical protein